MKRDHAEIVGSEVNAATVLLPGRRFPGLVIQGDSLAVLTGTARRVRDALKDGALGEASEELVGLCELLDRYQEAYERAVRAAGLELPYPSAGRPDHE